DAREERAVPHRQLGVEGAAAGAVGEPAKEDRRTPLAVLKREAPLPGEVAAAPAPFAPVVVVVREGAVAAEAAAAGAGEAARGGARHRDPAERAGSEVDALGDERHRLGHELEVDLDVVAGTRAGRARAEEIPPGVVRHRRGADGDAVPRRGRGAGDLA